MVSSDFNNSCEADCKGLTYPCHHYPLRKLLNWPVCAVALSLPFPNLTFFESIQLFTKYITEVLLHSTPRLISPSSSPTATSSMAFWPLIPAGAFLVPNVASSFSASYSFSSASLLSATSLSSKRTCTITRLSGNPARCRLLVASLCLGGQLIRSPQIALSISPRPR